MEVEKTIQIPKFSSRRLTENVLWGLKDYIEKYILYPEYRPTQLSATGEVIKDGGQNQIEVRVFWRGKARVIPFIVLSPSSNFKETRSNFEMDAKVDEYITSTGGMRIAVRDRGAFGNMTVRMTVASDDADKRLEIADWILSRLIQERGVFVYQDPDGMGSYMVSFTNDGFKMGEPKDVAMNNETEYLYFLDIDVPMFIEYHTIEQVFPGVTGSMSYTTEIVTG